MPDITTALQNAIAKWEHGTSASVQETAPQPTETPKNSLFQPTNNISRTTFDMIRDNPGIEGTVLQDRLGEKGFNRNSVSSLTTQMVRQNMVHRNEAGCLWALIPEYRPIKAYTTVINAEKRKQKAEAYARRMATRKATLEARKKAAVTPAVSVLAPTPAPVSVTVSAAAPLTAPAPAPVLKPEDEAEALLNRVSIMQAWHMYRRLKQVFEG